MPEHRIERRTAEDEPTIGLEPPPELAPPPMLARGIGSGEREPLPCPACGYDLRGLRSGVCSECGTLIDESAVREAREINAGLRRRRLFKRDGLAWRAAEAVAPLGSRRAWGGRGISALVLAGLAVGSIVGLAAGGTDGLLAYLGYAAIAVVGAWLIFGVLSLVWLGFDQTVPVMLGQVAAAIVPTTAAAQLIMLVGGPMAPLFSLVAVVVLVVLLMEIADLDPAEALIAGGVVWIGVTYLSIAWG
ncbi:MAG: hypothetical protein AAGF47_06075 [Planctomycetota bacterium]